MSKTKQRIPKERYVSILTEVNAHMETIVSLSINVEYVEKLVMELTIAEEEVVTEMTKTEKGTSGVSMIEGEKVKQTGRGTELKMGNRSGLMNYGSSF